VTLFALSTGNQLGLGLSALAWIIFSLVVSMVVPRYRPGFPGKNLPAFLALSSLFFVAMVAAVFVFGKEEKAHGEAAPASPALTQTGVTSTTSTAPPSTSGGNVDLAAGKAAWDKGSCGGCHVLKAANGTGTVGPNLDEVKPDEATVAHQVENGGGAMPPYKGVLSPQQITDVAAYVAHVAGQ
jgi:mono/diheme cytochrome c family protein